MNDKWYKFDNVAKVFLANHNARNPQSLRISFTLKEDINPEMLQSALVQTIAIRPEVSVRIRRGFFWHYMEHTNEIATVKEECERLCPSLYGDYDHMYCHYEVTYYKKRINFEIFHAIADGTGAFNFTEALVLNYLKLAYPSEFAEVSLSDNASSSARSQNSFDHFYYNSEGTPIPKTILNKKKKAYLISSRKLAYNQLQFFEVHMETEPIRQAAKAMGVGLTAYIGAVLMMAIKDDMPFMQKHKPVTISMPVNLRNYYPSETIRNFFNNVDFSHVFKNNESLEELAQEFNDALKIKLDPENIDSQMNRYQSIERLWFTRLVPLFIKQPVVKTFAKTEKKRVTAVLSNLGVIKLPPKMAEYVTCISDFCSTETLFITVTSYGNDLVFGITNAYQDTGVIKRFIHTLSETGTSCVTYVSDVLN